MGLKDRKTKIATASAALSSSELKEKQRFELQTLVYSIPDTLIAMLEELFKKPRKHGEPDPTPSVFFSNPPVPGNRFGYPYIIGGKAVTNAHHEEICVALLAKLRCISDWFAAHSIDARPIIEKAKSYVESRFGREHCESEDSHLISLEVLEDMANGKLEVDILPELMTTSVRSRLCEVRAIIEPTLVKLGVLRPPVLSTFSEVAQDGVQSNADYSRRRRRGTRKRGSKVEADRLIADVLKSNDALLIEKWIFANEDELATLCSCARTTVMKTEFWMHERKDRQQEWRRNNNVSRPKRGKDL